MKKNISLLITAMFAFLSNAQEVKVTSGKIQRFANFQSKFIDARNIDVWLPDGYSSNEKHAVLYMHDGQALYDAESTWNKLSWEVDEAAGKLIADGKTQKIIVVGIANNGMNRHPEYFPQKPYAGFETVQKQFISDNLIQRKKIDKEFNPISDQYLKFIVTELKPFIDKKFSTKSDQKNTYIMGSSMGGLISLYAICEYPNVFGAAACLSTHWTGIYQNNDNPIPAAIMAYLKNNLPNPKNHKIYFDYGDQTLDSLYKPSQDKVDLMMKAKGYTNKNWETRFFPGENHSEEAWARRLDIPLYFLLKK